jgi:hypothetical protein
MLSLRDVSMTAVGAGTLSNSYAVGFSCISVVNLRMLFYEKIDGNDRIDGLSTRSSDLQKVKSGGL